MYIYLVTVISTVFISCGFHAGRGIHDVCPHGYPTDSAWDPVTGLRTIRFDPFVQCAKIWQDNGVSGRSENESKASASGSQSVFLMAFNILLIAPLSVFIPI